MRCTNLLEQISSNVLVCEGIFLSPKRKQEYKQALRVSHPVAEAPSVPA
jgi:hypothetical protein